MTLHIRRSASSLALALLASCGASGQPGHHSNGGGAAALVKFSLASDAFKDGQPIPAQYTCDGANQRPMFSWGEPPPGTRSFALVIADPDAPGGTFRHWGVFNIPSTARSLGGAEKAGSEVDNDFGKPGYGGPCPPRGHGPHHYHVTLFALGVDRLGLSPNARVVDVERTARKHAIGDGEMIGTYERK